MRLRQRACIGRENASAPVPAIGSVPELTAQQILERAIEATDPITSIRGVGELIGYGADEERQVANQTIEWLAPNRTRQQYASIGSDEYTTSEVVIIGSQFYQRIDAGPWRLSQFSGATNETRRSPFSSLSDLVVDAPVEIVGINGVTAYKISGAWQLPAQSDSRVQVSVADITQTVFIDAVNFLVVRMEQLTISGPPVPLNSQPVPGAVVSEHLGPTVEPTTGPDFQYRIEWLMDYTYPTEEFVIEPPEVTADNLGIPVPDDRIDSTPTPVQRQPDPLFTPTAVVIPTQ